MPTVRFEGHPAFEVPAGTNLLEAAEDHDVPMESECGGFAACNSCRVRVLDGASGLTPLRVEEQGFLDEEDQRLGCQCEVLDDVVLRLEPGIDVG